MSKFVKSRLFETEFDGDKVSVTLKAINYADALLLEEMVGDIKPNDSSDETGREFFETLIKIVPKYATDLQGLRAQDGTVLAIQDVIENFYFYSLLADIGAELLRSTVIANPQKSSESKAPSAGSLEG